MKAHNPNPRVSPTTVYATRATSKVLDPDEAFWLGPYRIDCLALDSHAKVQMRRKIRGLRSLEREVLQERQSSRTGSKRDVQPSATPPAEQDIVLDYCAAVRGILNDSQGGPLRPPGVRMSEALGDIRRSLQKNLRLKKGAALKRDSND